jgi:predicted glycoside hydrolase/deacetylase ChbG (UPF0249 family)
MDTGTGGAPFDFALCADDFALSAGVSRGILEAVAAGRLSATSAMTTRPRWAEDARALAGLGANVDVGLHVNLTLGHPLGPIPTLAPAGALPQVGRLIRAARRGALDAAEIEAEIGRQLDAFAAEYGRAPDFVDGHQHVQVLPQVREALFAALAARGLAGRLWIRASGDRPLRILRRGIEPVKALAVGWLARGFAPAARARGFGTNEGFAGFSSFAATRDFGADFGRYLAAPGARHLVMCHPGHVDAELAALDPVTSSRERELAFLLSAGFPAALAARGARLARMRDMIGRRQR